jgi:PAS domain S-box-containing protein
MVRSAELVKQLRAQAAIAREEKAKVEAIFSSLGEGIIATNEQGNIIRVNQVALDILGYSRRELIGQWFPAKIQAIHEDGSEVESVERPIIKSFIIGKTINERMYYRTKGGTSLPVAVSVSPIMLHGKPHGAIEIFRDITAEIQNDQMKTDFISIASHQLRTPLASIKTYSHMIADGYAGPLNKTQRAFTKTILAAADRMNELISTLLNVARIEAGNVIVDSQPVQLKALAKNVVKECMVLAEQNSVKLSFKSEQDVPAVQTDKLLVHEIVVNLLTNAIKYTEAGGSVTVSLYTKGYEVILCVHDTGYGIPVVSQSHIFTKFFRAPNVLDKEVGGTGLGLYLIKILAERLGGEVWFKSREGYGTDFFFALPKKGSSPKTGQFRLEGK